VFERCTCGRASLFFRPSVREHGLLAEAGATDSDGVPIWLLLFGKSDELELDEIEVQRADGQPIIGLPETDEVTVTRSRRWR
jgi:hypothetical protein